MRRLKALWRRLRGVFSSDRSEQDFADELDGHVAMHIEDGVRAGLSREEARRQALIRLGGLEQAKIAHRERRGLPLLETLAQDVRYGLRLLGKSPGFACVSVVTLALGIGANTAIFSVVKAVLLATLPYKDPGRIVAVWTANPARGGQPLPTSPGDFAHLETEERRLRRHGSVIRRREDADRRGRAAVPDRLCACRRIISAFSAFSRNWAASTQKRRTSPKARRLRCSVIISGARHFIPIPSVVGKAITLEGKPYTVLGVMPRGFDYPPTVEIWTPAAMAPSDFDDFKHTYVRILGAAEAGSNARGRAEGNECARGTGGRRASGYG